MSQPFTVECCDGWFDITDDLEVTNPPWTLAKTQGSGALQFSVACYKNGPVPNSSPQDLVAMLWDFASANKLQKASDIIIEVSIPQIAAASFSYDDDFVRVWYVSDGSNFAKITYTCIGSAEESELIECEEMIRTLQFTGFNS